jgi:glutaredoxin 2
MKNMVQTVIEGYDELLKAKKEYEDKKNEYEQKIVKEGLIRFEYIYRNFLGGDYSNYYYDGKEGCIKTLTNELNEQQKKYKEISKELMTAEAKYSLLKQDSDLEQYNFMDRLKFLFTGKLHKNESK